MPIFSTVTTALFLALMLLSFSSLAPAQGRESAERTGQCNARVNIIPIGTHSGTNGTTHKYLVNVTTDVPTASVSYRVTRSYVKADGSRFNEGVVWDTGVRDGSSEEIGEHRESDALRPAEWSVDNVVCRRSGPTTTGRDTVATHVCDLTGRWVDQATARSRQYTTQLKSDGSRVTGHATGPNILHAAFAGQSHNDGTVELRLTMANAPDMNYSLRANADCSRLHGSYSYPGAFGLLNLHSGTVDMHKQ